MKKFPTALTVPNSNLKVWLTMAPPLEASAPAPGRLCVGPMPPTDIAHARSLRARRSPVRTVKLIPSCNGFRQHSFVKRARDQAEKPAGFDAGMFGIGSR